jgi:hypothetical protein
MLAETDKKDASHIDDLNLSIEMFEKAVIKKQDIVVFHGLELKE